MLIAEITINTEALHQSNNPLEVVSRYRDPQIQVGTNIYICMIWIKIYAQLANVMLIYRANVLF